MTRTMIELDTDDKAWLKAYAAQQGMSMAEVVRSAIRRLRQSSEPGDQTSLDDLLQKTKGIRTRGDGLEVQKSLRNEKKCDISQRDRLLKLYREKETPPGWSEEAAKLRKAFREDF